MYFYHGHAQPCLYSPGLTTFLHWPIVKPSLRKGKEKSVSLFCFLTHPSPYPLFYRTLFSYHGATDRACIRPGLTTVYHWPIVKPSLRKGKEKFVSLFCFLVPSSRYPLFYRTLFSYHGAKVRVSIRPGSTTVCHWPIVKPSLKKRDKEKFATFFGSLIQPPSQYQLFLYTHHSMRYCAAVSRA